MSRYVGILKEKEFGVNPENSDKSYYPNFINVGSCSLDAASDVYMEIPTMEETPRRAKKGFYSPEGEMEQMLDLPTAPYFLEALMGGYLWMKKPASPSTPPQPQTDNLNAHCMWVSSGRKLPSYSIYVGKENAQANGDPTSGGFEHRFHGCVASSGSFEISGELANYNLSFNCQRDAQGNIRPDEDISVDEEYPLAFYEVWIDRGERTMKTCHVKNGAETKADVNLAIHNFTDISAKAKSFNWELDNGTDPETGKAFGQMHPARILAGTKEPSLTIGVEFNGPDDIRRFWGLSAQDWSKEGAGPTGRTTYFSYRFRGQDENMNYFEMLYPKCYFKTVPATMEGSDLIEPELEIGVLKDKVCIGRPENMPNWSVSSPTIDLSKGLKLVDTSCLITIYNKKDKIPEPPEV